MKQRHWREMVEIVGVLSIVAAVLLLAWEVRQSNHIARANLEYRLASATNEIHLQHATNPEFARLYPKIEYPEQHLITATDASQMRGLATHLATIFYAAQIAYDHGLLDSNGLNIHTSEVSWTLRNQPALREHFIYLYETTPAFHGKEVFAPVAELIAAQKAAATD